MLSPIHFVANYNFDKSNLSQELFDNSYYVLFPFNSQAVKLKKDIINDNGF